MAHTSTDETGGRVPDPLPHGRIRRGLATLDPGYFAAVMATGIVSIACRLLGFGPLADTLLSITAAVFVVLAVAYVVRAVLFPRRFVESLRAPSSAVSYFTVVAGLNVLATALLGYRPTGLDAGLWGLAVGMGAFAFLVWLLLCYGLLCSIVLAGNHPALREFTGVWLVWVVGTQSIAVVAAALAGGAPEAWIADLLGVVSVLFWSVGVVLYLILVVIIFLRLFLIETTPAELGPAYWILMGATAISVRAAVGILEVASSDPTPLLQQLRPFVVGLSVVMWSFGSWFIPMLVLFGLWRYVVRRYSWRYEPKLWSVVFPLGMYTVASFTLGRAVRFDFPQELAAVWLWFAVAAWLIVAGLAVVSFVRPGERRSARR